MEAIKIQTDFPNFTVGLDPLPDETLFSWCSRFHRLAANGQDKNTCLQLFGDTRIGSAHDFPARIAVLVTRSHGCLGTASEIIRDRTLLPFYLPFKSIEVGNEAVSALCGPGIGHLKFRLGLLTSGVGAAHPLKACPQCICSDLDRHGWAYWRRSHQLPSVWLCPEHLIPLRASSLKLLQVARFAWVLPTQANCAPLAGLEDRRLSKHETAWLLKLSQLSNELLNCPSGSFADPVRIAEVFRIRLCSLGLTYASGRVRWPIVQVSLEKLVSNLACLPAINHEADLHLLRTQFLRILSGRGMTHPLRYLIWISTWFNDLSHFKTEYDKLAGYINHCEDELPAPNKPMRGPTREQMEIIAMLCTGQLSLSAAALRAGVAYATMAAWASKESFEVLRRPKKLSATLWNQAVAMLRAGADKSDVGGQCQVSVVTVTRILRTVPGLQEHWHSVRYKQRGDIARRAWSNLLPLRKYMGIKALRCLEPSAYAWLYRNDRVWLQASLAGTCKIKITNHAARRIENADERMAVFLKKLTLSRESSTSVWRLDELKRAFPRIEKVIRYPERWPLTVKALAFVLVAEPL
ncbi:TnsD family Tn7-like transposition protein [Undibacterium sp. KW1]|uniref:TnsD family Tn7-like transposition protein n=1 Tax=Undibacterium sp. KW1 TaxID=2058624 RepID=UPI00138A600E|nr:TnsD family Tn7-like transposition protein [Undibacterium sp. KW1]